jgi:hypothetical protein
VSEGLLSGVRVVEVAHATTEHAGRTLAELGAEVYLVEPPGGSPTRERHPYAATADPSRRSIPFLARNAGKKSVMLDPSREDDRTAFRALVATADALIAPAGAPRLDTLAPVRGPVVLIDDDGLGASSIVALAAGPTSHRATRRHGWRSTRPVSTPPAWRSPASGWCGRAWSRPATLSPCARRRWPGLPPGPAP